MSDILKTGLILGAAGLVAFLIYERSQAQASGLTSTAASGTPAALTTAPGQATAPIAAGSPATATGSSSSSSSSKSTLVTVAKLAAAPVYYPTQIAVDVGKKAVSLVTSIF